MNSARCMYCRWWDGGWPGLWGFQLLVWGMQFFVFIEIPFKHFGKINYSVGDGMVSSVGGGCSRSCGGCNFSCFSKFIESLWGSCEVIFWTSSFDLVKFRIDLILWLWFFLWNCTFYQRFVFTQTLVSTKSRYEKYKFSDENHAALFLLFFLVFFSSRY